MSVFVAKRILITGSGTGIGKASAIALAKKGHTVFAATLNEEQATEMSTIENITGLKLDITSAEDRAKVAPLKIDVLMNNAGVGYSGSLAEVDVGLCRKNMEINVFSSLELTQATIGGMIERKQGTIIFVSSIGGRIAFPFVGPYCMTKYALQAAAECLRAEMETLGAGIKVCLLEPGPYHTGFNQSIMGNKFAWMKEEGRSYFSKEQVEALEVGDVEALEALETESLDDLIAKVVEACEAEEPVVRYSAPESLFETIVKPAEVAR